MDSLELKFHSMTDFVPSSVEEASTLLSTVNGFPLFKHPFFHSICPPDFINGDLIKRLRMRREQALENLRDANWVGYVFTFERPYRLEALVRLIEFYDICALGEENVNLTERDLAEIFLEVFSDAEMTYVNEEANKILFRRFKSFYKEDMKDLPDTLKIYRGASERSKNGISWSLSKKTAEFFCNRFGRQRKIYQKTVKKEDIYAYIKNRGEEEVIVF